MSLNHRLRKARQSHNGHPAHQQDRSMNQSRLRPAEEIRKGREKVSNVYLMVNVQPITRLPWWAQWVVRFIYFRYGWAAMAQQDGKYFSLEYRGVTPDEAEARHLSSETNCSYTKVPWRSCLPVETGQYGTHDFPLSEASSEYRNRELPYVTIPKEQMAQLEQKVERVYRSAQA